MHRIEGEDFISIGGKSLFQDGPPGTRVEDDWLNAVQEEIANVIEDSGGTLLTAATDTRDQLKDAIKIISNQYALFRDIKASGTNGGSAVSEIWTTRVLNTLSTNITTGVSLTSNQFTLPAGTWEIIAFVPSTTASAEATCRIYNITDSTVLFSAGYKMREIDGTKNQTIKGSFTISSSKTFEVQHYFFNTFEQSFDFGRATSLDGDEIYTQVYVKKIGE